MNNPIVQVEGLVKVVGGNVRALDGISLACELGISYGLDRRTQVRVQV